MSERTPMDNKTLIDLLMVLIGAVAVALAVTFYLTTPQPTPKQKACAAYRDLIDAATENGNEQLYVNSEFERICGDTK